MEPTLITSFIRSNYGSLRGPARTLALVHFLDSVGAGIFMSGSAVYFVLVTGLPPAQVGLGLSVAGLAGFVSSVVMGTAADRIGARQLLLIALPLLGVTYAFYPMVDSAPAFFVLIGIVGALEWGSAPLFHALIAELVTENDRVSARAALRSLFNVGFSIGALAAAVLIGLGTTAMQALPLGNGLSFLLAGALVLRLPRSEVAPSKKERVSRVRALRNKPFVGVIAASSLLALHGSVIIVGVPLWIVTTDILPNSLVPVIFVVNTILVVLFQVRFAKGSETVSGSVTAARKAGAISVVACLALALGDVITPWVAGFVVLVAILMLTFAEIWQSASALGLSFGLAPEAARGEYLGAFHLHVVLQATLGPAMVSYLVTHGGAYGWLTLCAVFAVGTLVIAPLASRARGEDKETVQSLT